LTKKLRTGRPLRKLRRSPMARTPRFIAPGRLIHERPAVVEQRTRICDWEGDLIVGRASRSAIGTLVDRRTCYLRLVHLLDGHSAEQLHVAMLPVLTGLPDLAGQTLTWDRGSERWPATSCWRSSSPTASSSHRRPAHGCAARTRTPTGSCASTSPRAATCAPSPSPICERSNSPSTTVPGSD
jgi:hypothetical protein